MQEDQISKLVHRTKVRVLYGDTDAAGVVYNANYLRFFETGRTEFMRELVCSYKDIEKLGLVLPVTECYSRFKAPARYDDLLTIETSLVELKKVSCRFDYRIIREGDEDSQATTKAKLLAKGYTVHASVNREGKLVKLPSSIIEKLRKIL